MSHVVGPDTIVTLSYTLTGPEGQLIDTTEGRGPLTFLYGLGLALPGLERLLKGRKVGAKVKTTLKPAQAFGERLAERVMTLPRSQFPEDTKLKVGAQMVTRLGEPPWQAAMLVREVSGNDIVVDLNHPLAGEAIELRAQVLDVRPATPEEVAQARAALGRDVES